MPAVETHPNADELAAYASGTLDDATQADVEEHIDQCPACQRAAADSPADPFVRLLRTARSRDGSVNDTPMPIAAGTRLDAVPPAELIDHPRYQLLRPLGAGGMGTVWLAEHKVMGRRVALKVIRPEFLARPGAVERFRREARAAAALQHPNIVAAYDAEQAGGTHFLVMEYVEGRTLAELIATTGPLPSAEACRIAVAVAHGVQHAHEHGIVHRDLKPGNILIGPISLIGPTETPKIADFGLATIAAAESGLTAANMVVGTPDYIAPEQAEDPRAADARSDVYALGCTLYEMLTGRVPFPGESVLRKLDAHRGRNPEALPPGVSPGLAAIVAKMMAKRPADRYQSAAACATALEPFTNDNVAPKRSRLRLSANPRITRGLALSRKRGIAALAFLVFVTLLAGVVMRVQTDDGEVVVTVDSPDAQVVLLQGGKEIEVIDTKTKKRVKVPIGDYDVKLKDAPGGLAVTSDKITVRRGKEALVTIEHVAAPKLGPKPIAVDFAFPTEGGEIRSIAQPWHGELGNPLSPDGKYVLVPVGSGKIDRIRLEEVAQGYVRREVALAGEPTWASFAGGRRPVFSVREGDGHGIYSLDMKGHTLAKINHFAGCDLTPVLLQLSDDANLLAWAVQDRNATTSAGVDSLDHGSKRQFLVAAPKNTTHATMQTRFSPNGRYAAAVVSWDDPSSASKRSGRIHIRRLDASDDTRSYLVDGDIFDPFVTDDGRAGAIVYRRGQGYSVDWWPPHGKTYSQRVGALDSRAVYSDGRGARVAVLMSDRTIRVEDVGGWAMARCVCGSFEKLKGCWLSADGSTMAVQTDTHLHLYRLPPLLGAQP